MTRMNEIWPDFFIIGTSRAGTTSLYNYLDSIPDVFLAPKGRTNLFFPEVYHKKESKDDYLKLFLNSNSKKIRGEYAGYLDSPDSALLIKNTIPKSKIIICLRDPIERAFSHYLGALRSNDESISFQEAFDNFMIPLNEKSEFFNHYIKPGLYYNNVKTFLDVFGVHNVKTIIFEEFIREPEKFFQQILDFLELKVELPPNVGKTYNAYAEPLGEIGESMVENKIIKKITRKFLSQRSRESLLRLMTNKKGKKPHISDEQRKILKKFYISDSIKLRNLLNRELPWSLLEKKDLV